MAAVAHFSRLASRSCFHGALRSPIAALGESLMVKGWNVDTCCKLCNHWGIKKNCVYSFRVWSVPNTASLYFYLFLLPLRGYHNGGLEKARAYLNQVPWDRQLNVPSEGHDGNLSPQFLDQGWVYPEENISSNKGDDATEELLCTDNSVIYTTRSSLVGQTLTWVRLWLVRLTRSVSKTIFCTECWHQSAMAAKHSGYVGKASSAQSCMARPFLVPSWVSHGRHSSAV